MKTPTASPLASTVQPRLHRLSPLVRSAAFFIAALSLVAVLPAQNNYTPYLFTTLAGSLGAGSVDGTGGVARFNSPESAAVDASGNIYVADAGNQTIRKVTSAGVVTTFAGLAGSVGSADGTGSAARFSNPTGVAVDTAGNVYVADTDNSTIRKITSAGVVTTFAGTAGVFGAADGTGSAAVFRNPTGVAVDSAGNVYVADTNNQTIRKITSARVVTTLAGTPSTIGSSNGTGSAALFNYPSAVAVDGSGNVTVADYGNFTIRQITPAAVVTTLAGSAHNAGSADGTGVFARFYAPAGVAVDASGNVYVADYYNEEVRKITPGGVVTSVAGTAGIYGSADGTGSAAHFYYPQGVAVDAAGNLFVADKSNNSIRKITPAAVVTTVAGTPSAGAADGTGTAAQFEFPAALAVDSAGSVFVADTLNHTIRKITSGGAVTTLAGLALNPGSLDGTGSSARFNNPAGIAVDAGGNVYVADTFNHTIRKVTSGGLVTTFAGTAGSSGSLDGTGSAARFKKPYGLAVDGSGNVYVADGGNSAIRKITSGGVVTTLAGLAGSTGSTDGTGSAARFNFPTGVAVDGSGNVYVADLANFTIRKITPGGVVTTLAGTALVNGSADGTGGAAQFNYPQSVAVDAPGNIYVADGDNSLIRKVTPGGTVTTLGGLATVVGSTNGAGSSALFNIPTGVAVGTSGIVYVADSSNSLIRKGVPGAAINDFNTDGKSDIIWQNTSSGDRGFWLMTGTTFSSWVDIGITPTAWRIATTGDFNGDGKQDILWENSSTGDRGFWLMNGTTFSSWVDIGVLTTDLKIVACADFNGDGKTDIVWENTVTGKRVIWLMNGTTFISSVNLGIVATNWHIVGTADFNADGMPDILWENSTTGERYVWLMNGTTFGMGISLGIVATSWHIAGVGDFNADGMPDIMWENTVTGDRYIWLMNGTTVSSAIYLGNVTTDWRLAN